MDSRLATSHFHILPHSDTGLNAIVTLSGHHRRQKYPRRLLTCMLVSASSGARCIVQALVKSVFQTVMGDGNFAGVERRRVGAGGECFFSHSE